MLGVLRHTLRFFLLTFFVLLIALALLTGLLRIGLPYMSTYKNEIQGWVSNYLKTPVEIGSMEFAWNGARPSLKLDRVSLIRDGKQKVDVKLDQVDLDINLIKSLFAADLHINQVTLSGADLALEYRGGEFRVSGNFRGTNGGTDTGSGVDVVAWLMNAGRVGLLNSRIKLIDTDRDINYVINDLNIRAENDGRFHQLRLDLDLPGQLGHSLEIGFDLTGDSDTLNTSSGNFYLSAPSLKVGEWLRIWPDRTFDMTGWSDVEAWGSWGNGSMQSLRATIDGEKLLFDADGLNSGVAKLEQESSGNQDPLYIDSIESDLFWSRNTDGWSASLDKLKFSYAGQTNQIKRLTVDQKKIPGEKLRELRLAAAGDHFRFETLRGLLTVLGSVKSLSRIGEIGEQISLTGDLRDWMFSLGLFGSSPQISLAGHFSDVSTKAFNNIPGFQNLSGEVAVDDGVGSVKLKATDFKVHSPPVFPESLAIEEVDAEFRVDLNNKDQLVESERIYIKDGGGMAFSQLSLSQRADEQLHVNLKSAFSVDDVTKAAKYLPTGIMGPSLVDWLESSIKGGRVDKGELLLIGNLKEFPFREKQGVFTVDVDITDGALAFLPEWPTATDVVGQLRFNGPGLSFEGKSGKLAGVNVFDVRGGISDFWRPTLSLSGRSEGRLQTMLNFANNGPLKTILEPALGETTGSGNADLNLGLSVPLMSLAKRLDEDELRVDGNVELSGNNLVFNRFDLAMDKVSGKVGFNQDGVNIQRVSGRYLGRPVSLSAKTIGQGDRRETRLKVRGRVAANRVLKNYQLPVDRFFQGESPWEVDVEIPYVPAQGRPAVSIRASSKLEGTTIAFPAPLNKAAEQQRQVAVNGSFDQQGNQRWRVTYDGFKLALEATPNNGLKSLAARVGNGALPEIADGIRVVGRARRFEFDQWISSISTIIDELPEGDGPSTPLMPISAEFSTSQMIVGSTSLGPATYRANTDANYVNGVVENQYLRGNIRQPREFWKPSATVRSRIAYIDENFFDALGDEGGDGDASEPLDPRKFPPMEIRVAKLVKGPLTLRDLVLRTEPDVAGMNITTLGFANNNAKLTGEGYWHLADPQQVNPTLANSHRTRIDLNLQSGDIGRTFNSVGFGGSMAEGRGTIKARLRWQGPGYAIDTAKIIGSLDLNWKDGRFLRVDPGAARLVGLFAFQELPRRLSLDFRDLVNDGLDYHSISGNLDLSGGIARIGFLQLEGPIGVIEVAGSTNLVDRTFDQKITVLPRLSAAVPILALLSGGATAGIGALVATPVLKALGVDFDRLGLSEYRLKGDWDDPELEVIEVTPNTIQ